MSNEATPSREELQQAARPFVEPIERDLTARKENCPKCGTEHAVHNPGRLTQCGHCGYLFRTEPDHEELADKEWVQFAEVNHAQGYVKGWRFGLALGIATGLIAGAAAMAFFHTCPL